MVAGGLGRCGAYGWNIDDLLGVAKAVSGMGSVYLRRLLDKDPLRTLRTEISNLSYIENSMKPSYQQKPNQRDPLATVYTQPLLLFRARTPLIPVKPR